MKHKISMILTAVILLSMLTGCGAAGQQASTMPENEEETVLTVRIVNQSAVNLYGIAASYSATGETLGSKASKRIDKKTGQAVYEFSFVPDELPTAPIDAFRLDVFAAEKAGEDYSDCGSAVIKGPQPGDVYTLALNGEEAAALTLSTAERDVEIFASEWAAQTAEHLSDETRIAIEFDPELMEFNNGLLAGLSHEDADRLYPRVENLPIDQAVYGQESKIEFRSRAENVLQRVHSENGPESVIAIVTHGGMVNQLYGALLHMPIGENCFFRTADTGIHIWEITEHGNYVIKANMDDHIRGI